MTYRKTIVCLANSRKPPSGRCVAGREYVSGRFGAWVRPVSARDGQEISEEERRYEDGADPRLLDVIEIQMKEPKPHHHQQENHLIDEGYYWEKKGRLSWNSLQSAIEDPGGSLWSNTSSSYNGVNDRVREDEAPTFSRSLYLIRPERIALVVRSEGGDWGPPRRRVRARFTIRGEDYLLSVTDPMVERQYLSGEDGETVFNDALLCISLSEPFHGYLYKLVAALIRP